MTCDFTSFPTVFQSYQDDGRSIMNGSVQRNSVYGLADFALSGDRTRAKPTELPVLPVHRKRGFITSANSDDTDQLLHLSSHISVLSTFASTRYHENHTN